MSFGAKLFQLRNERGIYQKEIAEFLSVSVGTISNYENGVHSPDLETLCRLAEYFHVTTDYMLELTENAASMEKLNTPMAEEHTIGSTLNILQKLSGSSRRQMLKYLNMIKTCEEAPKRNRIIGRQRQTIEQQNQTISQQTQEISRLKKLLQLEQKEEGQPQGQEQSQIQGQGHEQGQGQAQGQGQVQVQGQSQVRG